MVALTDAERKRLEAQKDDQHYPLAAAVKRKLRRRAQRRERDGN